MEEELDGASVDITCPICDGEGKIDDLAFLEILPDSIEQNDGLGGMEKYDVWFSAKEDLKDLIDCPICDGEGIIEDVEAHGSIEIELSHPPIEARCR